MHTAPSQDVCLKKTNAIPFAKFTEFFLFCINYMCMCVCESTG